MIHVEDRGEHGRVRLVTIDRPERRNALDHDALEGLLAALEGAPAATRVLVLAGAGGHFCAGADLSGVEDTAFVALLNRVLALLRGARFPTIAAVEGAALGAGTQLAVACDLRVATAAASFGIPAGKLGLMVNHWTVQRVATLAGPSTARAILLAAEVVRGDHAVRIGFANREGDLDTALAWATEIARLAPLTLAGHKVMLNRLEVPPVDADGAVEAAFDRAWTSADLQEGLDAFRARRTAEFHGR